MTTEDRLSGMLDLTDRLADLIEEENLALEDRRYDDVDDMLEEKSTLARLYESRFKALEKSDVDWGSLTEVVREELNEAANRLANAMAENTMRLKAGMEANSRVVDAVASALKDATPHAGTYSKYGRQGQEGTRAAGNSMALALDTAL